MLYSKIFIAAFVAFTSHAFIVSAIPVPAKGAVASPKGSSHASSAGSSHGGSPPPSPPPSPRPAAPASPSNGDKKDLEHKEKDKDHKVPAPVVPVVRLHAPTALDIAKDKDIMKAFQEAWTNSFDTPTTVKETGGWIYARLTSTPPKLYVKFAQASASKPMKQIGEPPKGAIAAINLGNPVSSPGGCPPAECILVANFHTHPMGQGYGGDAPSRADQLNAWERGVPGFIVSRSGLHTYGPEQRENLTKNPSSYPNPMEVWAGRPTEKQIGTWKPTKAPNQIE